MKVNNQEYSSIRSVQYGISKTKQNKTKKKKKKLSYNAREISSQILRAAHSTGVSQVLVRAKAKVEQLQRRLVTGDYDEQAVRAALVHAKRMVTCARKKLRNMEEEELLRGQTQKRNPVQTTSDKMEEVRLQQQLKRICQKHRREENSYIKAADIRYMKDKIRQQQRESAENMSELTMLSVEESINSAAPVESTETSAGVDVLL